MKTSDRRPNVLGLCSFTHDSAAALISGGRLIGMAPASLAAELRRRLPDEPFTMTSVVTYLVARRTTAAP